MLKFGLQLFEFHCELFILKEINQIYLSKNHIQTQMPNIFLTFLAALCCL